MDPAKGAIGPLSSGRLTSGTALSAADATADDALVDSGYVAQNKLGVNQTIDVGGTNFKIIGIVSVPQGGSPAFGARLDQPGRPAVGWHRCGRAPPGPREGLSPPPLVDAAPRGTA